MHSNYKFEKKLLHLTICFEKNVITLLKVYISLIKL